MSNVPALQRQIFDLLDEYDTKNAAADSAVEALEAAAGNMRLASAVAGHLSVAEKVRLREQARAAGALAHGP